MTSSLAGLLPGMGDLFQALRFAVVASLTCGVGFLAGARLVETALFTGWGIGCLVFVAAGCLGGVGLAPAAAGLGLLGIAGLAWRSRVAERGADAMAWRVLALGAPMLLMLLSLRTTGYDDFSFWAPNLVALCLTGHFPVAAHPLIASFMPAYPRGVALSGYATWLLDPDPSPAGLVRLLATGPWWNILLLLALAARLGDVLAMRLRAIGRPAGRLQLWGLAGLAILLQSFLDPGFISKMTLTNMGDAATGSGLAMLMVLLFEVPGAGQAGWRIGMEMAFTAAAMAFVRQDNFALLAVFAFGAAVGLVLWMGPGRLRRLGWLAVAALPTLAVWLIWTHYTDVQIPGGAHHLLPVRQWHWAAYPVTLRAALRVLLSKGVYTLLAIGFGIGFLAVPAGHGPAGKREKWVLTATAALVFGNAAFILFTYLATSFTEVEVRTAVTFWRFLAQTAPAEMVALACLAPVSVLAWTRGGQAIALALIAALLPVALLDTPYSFRTDLQFRAQDFLGLGQSLAGTLPGDARLLLLDNSDGSGYVAWIVKFGLLELGGANNPVGISLDPQLFPGVQGDPGAVPMGSYALVTQSNWRPAYFPGLGIEPWHAYLFRRDAGGLELLRTWPIPRYGRKY